MQVTVLCFGHYADVAGGEPFDMRLPEGATVAALAEALAGREARFTDVLRRCRFAVNEEYARTDTPLQEGDTVAVLPPMSGG